MEFAIPREWQKQLRVQGCESTDKDLYEQVNLSEHLETDEKI